MIKQHLFFAQVAVLGVIAIVSVNCIDPTVTITESDPEVAYKTTIVAERDRDVTMSCYVENLPRGRSVFWQRTRWVGNKIETLKVSEDQAVEDNVSHGIEKPTSFTWRLRIRAVAVNDEGNYTCYVQVAPQRKTYDSRKLIVQVKPSVEPGLTSSDMTVREGDEVDLRCNATGRPTPYIQWERQGKALLPVGMEKYMGSHMHIRRIQARHRGLYRCVAFNDIGITVREMIVNVLFKPIITPVHDELKQKVGYVIELQCLVEANPDPDEDELSWYLGNSAISVSTDRYTVQIIRGAFNRLTYELIIDGVRESDFGDYTCQVKNDIGRSSARIRLRESNKPENSVKFGRPLGTSSALTTCLPTLLCALLLAFCLQRKS